MSSSITQLSLFVMIIRFVGFGHSCGKTYGIFNEAGADSSGAPGRETLNLLDFLKYYHYLDIQAIEIKSENKYIYIQYYR
jgi:hypothetical protein